jgi:hypothetical protein
MIGDKVRRESVDGEFELEEYNPGRPVGLDDAM